MKKLLLFCLMFAVHAAHAATDRMLVVETKDGGKVSFLLSADPQITFSGQAMHLNTDAQSQDFEIVNVLQYYFESTATGIGDLQKNELRIRLIGNDQMLVEGVASPSDLKLYAANGAQMSASLSFSDGKAVVSLSSLPKGIYIISVNDRQNIKFYRK